MAAAAVMRVFAAASAAPPPVWPIPAVAVMPSLGPIFAFPAAGAVSVAAADGGNRPAAGANVATALGDFLVLNLSVPAVAAAANEMLPPRGGLLLRGSSNTAVLRGLCCQPAVLMPP